MTKVLDSIIKISRIIPYKLLDKFYLFLDKSQVLRTNNIQLIPSESNRRGGKHSYGEWAHVVGIFQTLFHEYCEQKKDINILDVGCGTGLLGIASSPFVQDGGKYLGIDVTRKDIEFCQKHFTSPHYQFIHFDVNNPFYAPSQESKHQPWPFEDDSFNMVSALSVWTHLNEGDAIFYLQEVKRVLKLKGKAIITFFILDELYHKSLTKRTNDKGRFHGTNQKKWIFNKTAYDSKDWFCPEWVQIPENAIGITKNGLNELISKTGLKLKKHYQGNWKEINGLFFQDIIVFEK
ncbi:MAG: class I SAM-dependent methyltransferase [Candidatus Marinimicrobia bacterium]|nr:class I SAM-dependent methyltransferase [Candidatus Neomarinimicrobiota bacterium]